MGREISKPAGGWRSNPQTSGRAFRKSTSETRIYQLPEQNLWSGPGTTRFAKAGLRDPEGKRTAAEGRGDFAKRSAGAGPRSPVSEALPLTHHVQEVRVGLRLVELVDQELHRLDG